MEKNNFKKEDAYYHYVTLDLQFYVKINNKQLYYINSLNTPFIFDKELLLPISKIKSENETFNAPAKVD